MRLDKPQRRLVGAAVLSAVCIAACTLEPRYSQPAAPVAKQWPTSDQAPTATATAATTATTTAAAPADAGELPGWREFFTDPSLQTLIASALVNNRDLRVAVANVQLARAQYRVQRAASYPTVNANGGFTRSRTPPAVSGLPVSFIGSYFSADVGINAFELDLFGRVRSLRHAALHQYLAQEEVQRSVHLTLVAEVANAYLTLISDRQLLQLAQQTLQDQQKSYDLTKQRHTAGAVSGLDVAQAETTVDSARADAARYQGRISQDVDALTLLVGEPLDDSKVPPTADIRQVGIGAVVPGTSSAVLLRRPDVLAAEHTLRAANADIGAARAMFFPTISLTASDGSASSQLRGLFATGSGTWQFAPAVSLPIFQVSALRANLAIAKATRDVDLAQYEKSIQSAFKDVADALALSDSLAHQREAQGALAQATGQALDMSQQRYKAGRDSYLTVLDAERSHYSAEQGLISTMLAEQSNRIALYESLGGGWLEHRPATAAR